MTEGEQTIKVGEEDLAKMIRSIVHEEVEKHTPAPTGAQGMRLGRFQVQDISDNKEQVYCPTCGTTEYREKPVKVIEKPVVKHEVPDNYIPLPTKYEEFKALIDRPHPNGTTIWDCPNCSPKFSDYLKEHGFQKVEAKKK